MPEPDLFDSYATTYTETVDDAIQASGESTQFFAELKADLTERELRGRHPRNVLDFGCGIGMSTRALARALSAVDIMGCDPSRESIERAQAMSSDSGPRVKFVPFEGTRLPFDDATFDAAFTSCVFHHIDRKDHQLWAAELLRVLKPGGSLLLFEHNPYNPLTVQVVRRIPFDAGVILLEPHYTRAMLAASGFETPPATFYFFFPRFVAALRRLERFLRRVPIGAQYYVHARRPASPR